MTRLLKAAGLLAILIIVNVFTLLILLGPPSTGAQEPDPEQVVLNPGDINCDGGVNLADAIGLLAYLFDNGPTPSVCAQSTSPTALTREELVGALVESRNFFEPRVQDRIHRVFSVSASTNDCVTEGDLLLDVPDERMFVLTGLTSDGGSFPARFCISREDDSSFGVDPANLAAGNMFLYPGDELYVRRTSSSNTPRVDLRGYWMPYQEDAD